MYECEPYTILISRDEVIWSSYNAYSVHWFVYSAQEKCLLIIAVNKIKANFTFCLTKFVSVSLAEKMN